MRLRLFLPCLLLGLLAGCTLPRVVILNDPLSARQHNDLGVAYQERGEYDLALRSFQRATTLDREWALPLFNRGNLYAEQGQWRLARESYRQALRREPGNAAAMNNLSWVLLRSAESDEALVWAERAVAAAPQEPTYLDTLAEVRLALDDQPGARAALAAALALDPSPELRRSLESKQHQLDASIPRP